MSLRFLPQLEQEKQPPMPNAGVEFGAHGGGLGVLSKYSAALTVSQMDLPTERLKGVPSPWARLLLFEQALFTVGHPAHERIVQEWRGLLGVLGLAKYLQRDVEILGMDLATGTGAVQHLRSMLPNDQRSVLWDRMALIYSDKQLIGATSPRTLVYTGIRPGQTGGAPFQRDGRLVDPVAYYGAAGDQTALALLTDWIAATITELQAGQSQLQTLLGQLPTGHGAHPIQRTELLMAALKLWSEDAQKTSVKLGRPSTPVVKGYTQSVFVGAFPNDHPSSLVFARIRQVESVDLPARNDLTVAFAEAVAYPGASGMLMSSGHPYSGEMHLPRGMTRGVKDGRFATPTSALDAQSTWSDLGKMFQEKLIPVAAVHANAARTLVVGNSQFLFPFDPQLLKYIPADLLATYVTVSGDPATLVNVTLSVPLRSGLQLVYKHEYSSSDVMREEQVSTPLLTEWPDFEAPGWKHYFYYVRQAIAKSDIPLWFEPHSSSPTEPFSEDASGVRWGTTATPPGAWVGRAGGHIGLLPATRRAKVADASDSWRVSVDFGSTHTRAFRAKPDVGGKRTIDEVPLRPRTRSVLGEDAQLAFFFFGGQNSDTGSDAEPPSLVWLPLGRTVARTADKAWLPAHGIMYWSSVRDAPPVDGLRGNLKWHGDSANERAAFHNYLAHLFLAISAEAAANGASIESVITAYPSVLPMELRHRHRQEWLEVQRIYGVNVDNPRSESDAIAAFFSAGQGATPATNLLAVDIGGSTADLAIWVANRRAYSDSVRFAGEILSRLISSDSKAREAVTAAVQRPPFNGQAIPWEPGNSSRNGLIFNSLLRELSQNSVFTRERDVLARNLYDGQGSGGERLIAHIAFMFAVNSFFLGMAARKCGLTTDRYDLRFAGKGSEFLHWLEALSTGASRSLPAAFFSAGAGLSGAQVQVTPPGHEAKQEVGRGLLSATLDRSQDVDERVTMMGEDGFTDGTNEFSWNDDLMFDVLKRIAVPKPPRSLSQLANLATFIKTFDADPAARKAARALGIESARLNSELRDRIHNRLFGVGSAWAAVQSGGEAQEHKHLLEPFFITEAKALLEHTTENHELFAP